MYKKSKTFFTLFLLLYFVGVIVSPVSAICPTDEVNFYKHNYSYNKHTTQTDLFLFDMAYWVLLKNTKHSTNVNDILSISAKSAASETDSIVLARGLIENFGELSAIPKVSQYHDTLFVSAYSVSRSTHSGLSPPFFS